MHAKVSTRTFPRSAPRMIAVLLMAQASAANAQQSAAATDASATTIQEIVVTAEKFEESINKVGLTINALSAAQLEQQHVTSIQDLAAIVPGLDYTRTSTNTPVYTLRGVGFYDTTLGAYPSVSVYLDQAPLSFPVMTSQTLFDIERVEVLKGPQGTLFGNNATGGAINYIAAKPTEDFRAGASVDYARFNTVTTDAYVSGPLTSDLLARFAVKVVKGDGWQESVSRPGDTAGAPQSYAARLLLDWKPTDKLRVQTNINGWIDETQPAQAQFVLFIPNFPVSSNPAVASQFRQPVPNAVDDPRAADWTPEFNPDAHNTLMQEVLRIDYDLTHAITLTSQTSFVDYEQRERPLGDGTDENRANVLKSDGYLHSFNTELRLADNSDPVFRWTVGTNFSHDVAQEANQLDIVDSTSNHTDAFAGFQFPGDEFSNHQVMDNYAGFASGEYTIDQFTFNAGARYTEADRTSQNCEMGAAASNPNPIGEFFQYVLLPFVYDHPGVNIPNGSCIEIDPSTGLPHEFRGTLDQNNVSWRLGTNWKPTDTFMGYAYVAKGYKAGSFPALSGSSDLAFTPATQESVITYETGIKTQPFDRRADIDLSVFYSDYRDKQVKSKLNDPVFGQLDALVNIPKSTIKGVELQTTTRVTSGLTLGANATYLDATLDNTGNRISLLGSVVPGQNLNYSSFCGVQSNGYSLYCGKNGNPIPFTSKWNAGGNANYTIPIGENSVFIGGQVTYRSWTTSSIGNEPLFRMPGYTLVDTQAGYDFGAGKYRVMVWGKNIFNRFYVVNVDRYTDGVQRYTGMPGTFGVTFSAKF